MDHGDMDHGDGGHGGHGGHGGGMPMCNMNVGLSIPIHPGRRAPPICREGRTCVNNALTAYYTPYCRNAAAVVYRDTKAIDVLYLRVVRRNSDVVTPDTKPGNECIP
jgi:hypothetical protein